MTYDCFYFAYGSNMNPDRLSIRKKDAPEPPHILAIGKLINYRPRFSRYSMMNRGGVLDIIEKKGSCVYGIIYGIKRKYLHLIDKAEGAPKYYRQIKVDILLLEVIDDDFYKSQFSNEEYLNCYCYEVVNKEPQEIPPSRTYIDHVRIGKIRYGVNIDLIEKIISRIGYEEGS
ncbi:MAG: gamma-glutamylcyclotransferase family protein [Promethearchaeota archaeon]